MSQYIKDNKIINATRKAYDTVYKTQGYIPYMEKKKEVVSTSKTKKKKEEADK